MVIEEGHIYRIDTSLNPDNSPCGNFGAYHSYNGIELTRDEMSNIDENSFSYNSWWFSKKVLVDTGKKVERGVEKRTYLDFKVGDLVRIRSLDDLRSQFRISGNGDILTEDAIFVRDMRNLCGKEAIITELSRGKRIRLFFKNLKERSRWTFTTDMIEIVEEGYKDRIMKENEVLKISKEETKDDEIIKEMISKVDVNKIKKILAGSLRIKGTSLNGLDKLLEDWANAKKDIYLLFGRNLKLTKPIEYEMSNEDLRTHREMFAEKFHRFFKNAFKYTS